MTEVVAALIWEKDRFLICQRPAHKARGLMWEFVGGKVEPGETRQEALIRECREELDIQIEVDGEFIELIHKYPDLTIRLALFNARIVSGTPKLLEHSDIRWIRIAEIPNYVFCPADAEILEKLMHKELSSALFDLQDPQYKAFHCRLIPNISPDTVLGIRMPELRKFGRSIKDTPEAQAFLHDLPHPYYDENNLHGILISEMKDFDRTVAALDAFLPFVDNWATCDLLSPKAFRRAGERVLPHVRRWMASGYTYTVRFGIGELMRDFLDAQFKPDYLFWVADIHSREYYINMMIAWYFATALAKQYESTLPYFENRVLDQWTHNKAIQKAKESFRVTDAHKAYLSELIRKA